MGAHSLKKTTSNTRRFAVAGALAAGAAVAGGGQVAAAPTTVDVPEEFHFPGVPTQVDVELPPGIEVPEELLAQTDANEVVTEFAAPAPASTGQQVVQSAESRLGSPYAWGATGPSSFDCSGLTSWAYAQQGIDIPRTSQAQIGGGTQVARGDLQPGDLVAFYSGASHIGIYAGDGQVIHSPSSGSSVSYAPVDSMPFYGAARYH